MDNTVLLKKVPLFKHLKSNELKTIAALLKEKSFKKGSVILKQGDDGIGLYIIKKGKVKVTKKISSGKEIDIAVHGTEEFFGELSVLDNKPRTATVTAVEDSDMLLMTFWEFKAFLQEYPNIALDIIPVLLERFRETNEQLLELKNS